MPIDTSIYQMVQAPKMPSPFEQAQQAMTIQNLFNQNQFTPLQRQMALQKSQAEVGHLNAQTEQATAKAQASNIKTLRDSLASVVDDNDLARHRELVMKLQGPDAAAHLPQSVSDPSFQQGRAQKLMSADEALKRLSPELKTRDLGGTVETYNPFTNAVVGSQQKTMTPDQIAKNQRATSKASNLPTQALKLQQEELDSIGISSRISKDLTDLKSTLDSGKLSLGPVENLRSQYKNWRGESDENSRNYANLRATLEKMRNDSLRLNKGVQTEGDAQRAWNEIFQNMNDTNLVKDRLTAIQKLNDDAVNLRKMNIDKIRMNYGAEPLDISEYTERPSVLGKDNPNPVSPKPSTQKTFSSMPDPSQYEGKRVKGDDGTIYKSIGGKWVRQ